MCTLASSGTKLNPLVTGVIVLVKIMDIKGACLFAHNFFNLLSVSALSGISLNSESECKLVVGIHLFHPDMTLRG